MIRRGVSLIEVIVVITIISLLIALTVPAVQKAREAANRTTCQNNLKQLGLAIHQYHNAHQRLPPGRIKFGATWCVFVLPYIGQEAVHKAFDYKKPWPDQPNVAALQTFIPTFICPTRRTPMLSVSGDWGKLGIINWPWPPYDKASGGNGRPFNPDHLPGPCGDYAGNTGSDPKIAGAVVGPKGPKGAKGPKGNLSNGVFAGVEKTGDPSPITFASITDGLSNTFLIGEKHARVGFLGIRTLAAERLVGPSDSDGCMYNGVKMRVACRFAGGVPLANSPQDDIEADLKFGSWHPGICQFVFCDGTVRSVRNNVDQTTLSRLVERSDGKAAPTDY